MAAGGLKAPSLTPDRIVAERTLEAVDRHTPATLRASEAIDADDITLPGPGRDVVGLVVRPQQDAEGAPPGASTPPTRLRPGVVHVHGGGMVLGTRFWDLDEPLTWVRDLGAVCSPRSTAAP